MVPDEGNLPASRRRRRTGVKPLLFKVFFPLAVLLIGACATLPPAPEALTFSVVGRVGAVAGGQGASADFLWRQYASGFDVEFWGPLGQGRTRLVGNGEKVSVLNARGERIDDGEARDWLRRELRLDLPIGALSSWITGRPVPEQPVAGVTADGFNQFGWRIEIAAWDEWGGRRQPRKLSRDARRLSRHHHLPTMELRPMTMAVTPGRLRSLALAHQGLAGKRKLGSGLAGVEKALCRIGHVQIDTISVVARAHHHILYNRVGRYDESWLNRLVGARRAFEYWCHAAAYLPMRDYRFALPMMRGVANGEWGWWHRNRDERLRAWVLDRIRAEGPLFARDFEDSRPRRGGWWDRKPAKRALEQLFMEGELVSIERRGFQKRYELAERFLPSEIDLREPGLEEEAGYLIDVAMRAHGFATLRTINYPRRDPKVRATVRRQVEERVGAGALVARRTAAGESVYAPPGAFDAPPKRFPSVARILSPFDNVVIQRQRAAAVFDFDYTIECYVPAAKRRYGYFALPLLYRDRFVGRMDCKAHRPASRFEIKALFLERDVPGAFLPAFGQAVVDYAAFNGCAEVEVGDVSPRIWRQPISNLFA